MTILFAIFALAAGLIQGVTGFGAGIVMMLVLPYLYPLTQSAGISVCVSLFLLLSMVYTYRKYINFKLIPIPSITFLIVITFTIMYSVDLDASLMKKVFGIFLIVLAIYYLFFNKQSSDKPMSKVTAVFCIIISAICDGLFGIGGPLMVLYFMNKTKDHQEYIGTIQTFFMINCLYTTIFRIYKGILLPEHIMIIIIGITGIIIGGLLANKLVNRLDVELVKKLTYIMIGISGISNLI